MQARYNVTAGILAQPISCEGAADKSPQIAIIAGLFTEESGPRAPADAPTIDDRPMSDGEDRFRFIPFRRSDIVEMCLCENKVDAGRAIRLPDQRRDNYFVPAR